jgi:hypothetical protein
VWPYLGKHDLEDLLHVDARARTREDETGMHCPGEFLGLFCDFFLFVSWECREAIEFGSY